MMKNLSVIETLEEYRWRSNLTCSSLKLSSILFLKKPCKVYEEKMNKDFNKIKWVED